MYPFTKKQRKIAIINTAFFKSLILCLLMRFNCMFFLFKDQQIHPETKKPTKNGKKINHEHLGSNVDEYYSGENKNRNAFEVAASDRGHKFPMKNRLGNVNIKPTNAFDNVNTEHDESSLSRSALLFIGSLCQQGKHCFKWYFFFHSNQFKRSMNFVISLQI